jgi:hypothetical protein
MPELLIQQQPGQYRQLAQAIQGGNPYQQYYQQPQQQQQMPMPSGLMSQFTGGGGAAAGGGGSAGGGAGGAGASGGGGFGSSVGAIASNPYTWLAALLAAKAYDTKKHGGIGYEDQLKNVSLAPQSDFDRWGLDKYAPAGGGDIYKGSFDLATGDFSNWAKSFKRPIEKIFGVNI